MKRLSDDEIQVEMGPSLVRALRMEIVPQGARYVRDIKHPHHEVVRRYIFSPSALWKKLADAERWSPRDIDGSDYPSGAARAVAWFIREARRVLGDDR